MLLQVIPVLAKAQLYASMGLVTQAEAALAQAESLLDDGMPADSARQWRVQHWLLTRLLQLWKGDTLAMQQTGALKCDLPANKKAHSHMPTLSSLQLVRQSYHDLLLTWMLHESCAHSGQPRRC